MATHRRDSRREGLWRKRLARHAASGLSVRAFCRREKVTEPTFYAWRRTIGNRDAEAKSQARRNGRSTRPAFLPVVMNAGCDDTIAIELGAGRVLRLPAATTVERLAELVHALEAQAER